MKISNWLIFQRCDIWLIMLIGWRNINHIRFNWKWFPKWDISWSPFRWSLNRNFTKNRHHVKQNSLKMWRTILSFRKTDLYPSVISILMYVDLFSYMFLIVKKSLTKSLSNTLIPENKEINSLNFKETNEIKAWATREFGIEFVKVKRAFISIHIACIYFVFETLYFYILIINIVVVYILQLTK